MAPVLVVAVVVSGVLVWRWQSSGRVGGEMHADAVPIGTPKDRLVGFSLARQPQIGWQVRPTDIGLPPGVPVREMFASSGANAYFVTTQCWADPCADPTGWVYGLDTSTGAKLFTPVRLPGFYGGDGLFGDCYNNGPGAALCVSEGHHGVTAGDYTGPSQLWVIDLYAGRITFNGPTDIRVRGKNPAPGQRVLEQVGNYQGESRLVAIERDKGVYGIGSHGELTWFLPGLGTLKDDNYLQVTLSAPITIALQNQSGDSPQVFSALDGKDLTPNPRDVTLGDARVYPGGFAYAFTDVSNPDAAGVMFYNTGGDLIAREQHGRVYFVDSAQLPIVLEDSPPRARVYSAAGKQLLDIAGRGADASFKVIGSQLYVDEVSAAKGADGNGGFGEKVPWQQWDLSTGQIGPTCAMQLGPNFVASDGVIVVSEQQQGPAVAVDPATCQTLWQAPQHSRIYQVTTRLVRIDNYGETIVSLQAG